MLIQHVFGLEIIPTEEKTDVFYDVVNALMMSATLNDVTLGTRRVFL